MIHPQELRISNYVGATYAGNQMPPLTGFEASVFEANGFGIHRIISGADIDNAKDWYFPIPISEDWLSQLGFVLEFNYYDKGILSYSKVYKIFYYDGEMLETNVQYVHQLQNLYFALTGSELTIKE